MRLPVYILSGLLTIIAGNSCQQGRSSGAGEGERPNILWITSEDNSTTLGCYGDRIALTTNLDELAGQGVRYTNCFANAPVCAPTRNSWILGLPALTAGTHHMRSRYRVPDALVPYPVLLKEAGYYVTNNAKTDYNTSSFEKEIWDVCSNKAHYRNRPEGKPFFAVFNIGFSHEGQIFERMYPERYPNPSGSPEGIEIPPYQVNTPETIRDWQRTYERVADMDSVVGVILAELDASGEAGNTIIIYNSDHAGITLRTKRFLHDSGTRVPLIVYVPKKWKHLAPGRPGTVSDRLVQFIDMPRTWLSLAGAEVPDRMTGRIFMGESQETPPETVLLFSNRFDECPDMSRAVTDGRWKYIRNYEPDRPRYQMLEYPLNQSGQVSQWEEYRAGRTNQAQSAHYRPQPPEELYDTREDPHEVNNLAADPSFSEQLNRMRFQLDMHMISARDAGFIPEPMMAEIDRDSTTYLYEFSQSMEHYQLEDIIETAGVAGRKDPANVPLLVSNLKNEDPIIRYWSAVGLRVLGKDALPAEGAIEAALKDPEASVRINAMMALGNLGHTERAAYLLVEEAKAATTDAHANWALDGIRYLELPESIEGMEEKEFAKGAYSTRTFRHLAGGGTMFLPPEKGN